MSEAITALVADLEAMRKDAPAALTPLLERLIAGVAQIGQPGVGADRREWLAKLASQMAQLAEQAGDPASAVTFASIQSELQSLPDGLFIDDAPPPEPQPASTARGAVAAARRAPVPIDADRDAGPSPPTPTPIPSSRLLPVLSAAAAGLLGVGIYLLTGATLGTGDALTWAAAAAGCLLGLLPLVWSRRASRPASTAAAEHVASALIGLGIVVAAAGLWRGLPSLGSPTDAQPATGAEAATHRAGILPFWSIGAGSGATPDSGNDSAVATDPEPPEPDIAAHPSPPRQDQSQAAAGADRPRPRSSPPLSHREEPQQAFGHLLNRKVILIDINGGSHPGTLIGLDKDGATLSTEIMLRGRPIMASRLYLYEQIATVYPQ